MLIQSDGAKLYAETAGDGPAVIFVHEFADNLQSWSNQISALSRRYKCIAFNARGYPPSDVPEDPELYSQKIAAEDINAIFEGYEIDEAHIVGCSMGAFAALHFGLMYPKKASSITMISCGYGAPKHLQKGYSEDSQMLSDKYVELGAERMAELYAEGAFRQQFKNKDYRGWLEFKARLASHSTLGASLTMLGVQRLRPSLYDLEKEIKELLVPALVIVGDEDDWCIEPSIFLKRTLPMAGLSVFPRTAHTVNLEEPDMTNRVLIDFLAMVESGRWRSKQDYMGKSALLSGLK
mgnify:FL=1